LYRESITRCTKNDGEIGFVLHLLKENLNLDLKSKSENLFKKDFILPLIEYLLVQRNAMHIEDLSQILNFINFIVNTDLRFNKTSPRIVTELFLEVVLDNLTKIKKELNIKLFSLNEGKKSRSEELSVNKAMITIGMIESLESLIIDAREFVKKSE
jgi:hypothetical protein